MQTPPITATLTLGNLNAGATAVFEFRNPDLSTHRVTGLYIDNRSANELIVRWEATATADLADTGDGHASVPAGQMRGFEIGCTRLAVLNNGSVAMTYSDSVKDVYISGFDR